MSRRTASLSALPALRITSSMLFSSDGAARPIAGQPTVINHKTIKRKKPEEKDRLHIAIHPLRSNYYSGPV
jgi:hypothetical protein